MTTICTSASEHPATTNPLAQLRAARRKPVAAIIGATAGLVPVGVYEVGHHEPTSWSPIECPKALIVYAGLLFSALTNMFGARAKALGFTLLLEGIMMTSSAGWLTAIALRLGTCAKCGPPGLCQTSLGFECSWLLLPALPTQTSTPREVYLLSKGYEARNSTTPPCVTPIDVVLRTYDEPSLRNGEPRLIKFGLTIAEAPKLLRLLSHLGVRYDTVYPGLAGLVAGMKEQRLWDRAPPAGWYLLV